MTTSLLKKFGFSALATIAMTFAASTTALAQAKDAKKDKPAKTEKAAAKPEKAPKADAKPAATDQAKPAKAATTQAEKDAKKAERDIKKAEKAAAKEAKVAPVVKDAKPTVAPKADTKPATTTKPAPAPKTSTKPAPANTADKVIRKDDKGRDIYGGPRGGEYYINSNGNKTYVKNEK